MENTKKELENMKSKGKDIKNNKEEEKIEKNIEKKIEKKTEEKKFNCEFCNVKLKSKRTLSNHYKTCKKRKQNKVEEHVEDKHQINYEERIILLEKSLILLENKYNTLENTIGLILKFNK